MRQGLFTVSLAFLIESTILAVKSWSSLVKLVISAIKHNSTECYKWAVTNEAQKARKLQQGIYSVSKEFQSMNYPRDQIFVNDLPSEPDIVVS